MRSASVSLLYYISEASGGFGGAPGGVTTPITKPIGSKTSAKTSRARPGVDPSIMGGGGKAWEGSITKGAATPAISTGMNTLGLFGDPVGAATLSVTKDIAANAPERFKDDIRAQTEGMYRMTNVDQFYKNLGLGSAIPILPPKNATLLAKLTAALKP